MNLPVSGSIVRIHLLAVDLEHDNVVVGVTHCIEPFGDIEGGFVASS